MSPQLCFRIEEGERHETAHFDQPRVTIGRAETNDIRLEDRQASRVHCAVEWNSGTLTLTDLGSQNGTFLNGAKVTHAPIAPGDRIQVGACAICLETTPARAAAADPSDVPTAGPQSIDAPHVDDPRFLSRLVAVARDVASERELMPLLDRVLDAVLGLTGAERAFVMLTDKDGNLECEASRNFKGDTVANPDVAVSRSIARRVIAEKQAMLAVNAREDERFREVQSIMNLGLRSVLCAPLQFRGDTLGVVYIDHRLEAAVFGDPDKRRLQAFADQVAIAVANARMFRDLNESNRALAQARSRLESLNRDLRRTVADREAELASVRARLAGDDPADGELRYESVGIIGRSAAMRKVFEVLDRVIGSDFPVLVEGESGTGKELVARAIHRLGPRRSEAFVSENCAALPESLLESELFGSIKGAFTGAATRRGLVERAHGGTLFLDEVSEMSTALQSKLLRFLQEGEFRPVGGTDPVRVNVRIISACNKDLRQLVQEGKFREDLYYRLNVLPVRLPPLRQRREDVPVLIERFVARAAAASSRPVPAISPEVLDALSRYAWPGNVRELENEVRRFVTLSDGTISLEHVTPHVLKGGVEPEVEEDDAGLLHRISTIEIKEIRRALREAHGNKSRAAHLLGISRFALNRKMEKHRIDGDGPQTPG